MHIFIYKLILAFFSFKAVKYFLYKLNINDSIVNSKFHEKEAIRGFGIIFLIPIFTLLLNTNYNSLYKIFLTSVFISIIFFFIEDAFGLKTKVRFLYLSIIGIIFTYINLYEIKIISQLINLPIYFILILAIIGYCWFFNLYNFMDGIDLITGIYTISIFLSILILTTIKFNFLPNDKINYKIILEIIYSILPFLIIWIYYNKPIATNFLGDCGSISLGMITAFILTKGSEIIGINSVFIISAYYISDSTISLFRRIYRKENIFLPNYSAFFFQKPKVFGKKSSYWIVSKIIILNIILSIIAYFVIIEYIKGFFGLILGYFLTFILLIYFNKFSNQRLT